MKPPMTSSEEVASLTALTTVAYKSPKGSILVEANYPGVWISGPTGVAPKVYQSAVIAAYVDESGNPVIGLYGKNSKQDACDLAFTVGEDNIPAIQFRKEDGTIGFLNLEKLSKLCCEQG